MKRGGKISSIFPFSFHFSAIPIHARLLVQWRLRRLESCHAGAVLWHASRHLTSSRVEYSSWIAINKGWTELTLFNNEMRTRKAGEKQKKRAEKNKTIKFDTPEWARGKLGRGENCTILLALSQGTQRVERAEEKTIFHLTRAAPRAPIGIVVVAVAAVLHVIKCECYHELTKREKISKH